MLRRFGSFLLIIFFLPATSHAILSMELTQGTQSAIPVAIVPFANPDAPLQISDVITHDLEMSGRFKVYGRKELTEFPTSASEVKQHYFKKLGTEYIALGTVSSQGNGMYRVKLQLLDLLKSKEEQSVILDKTLTVPVTTLRSAAHHLSDLIYQQLTGKKGVFSTKLAYVLVQRNARNARYILEVSDHDGYDPRPLLISYEPIMSPAWSPDGRKLAYVSFEDKRAGIYIQDVQSGKRHLLSAFPGINGAPAWSPDGRKLAVVLSKSGSPNIYVMDIASKSLTPVTKDFYINTEPTWSKDGKRLLFTSNRSGGPQIYAARLADGHIERISFDGGYNARPSFAFDGKHVAIIHKVSGIYKIALLNLDSGTTHVLTTAHHGDSASPSVAPNGSMVLYDTFYKGRNVLAMVSADGRVHLVLPARNGEAQDPAWSPYLNS